MSYGKKICDLRRQKGLSQNELAEQIGVSRILISRWESEAVKPSPKNMSKLSEFFSVPYFYFDDESVAPVSGDESIENLKNEIAELWDALAEITRESVEKATALSKAIVEAERAEFVRRKKVTVAVLALFTVLSAFITAAIGIIVFPALSEVYDDTFKSADINLSHFVMMAIITGVLLIVTLAVGIFWKRRENR